MNLEGKISPKRLTFDFFPIHNQDLLYQSSSYTKGRYHSTHRFSLYWLNQRWMHFTFKVLRSGEVKRKGSNIDMSWFLVILAWHNDLLQELKPEKQFNIKDKIWSMKTRTKTSSKPKTHKNKIGKKKKKRTDMKNIHGVRELTWSPAS